MKYDRQAKIFDIIENNVVRTQDEIADKLKEVGMDVTQATISRDIKELRLIKVMNEDGRYIYAPFSQSDSTASSKMMSIFTQSFISSDYTNNLIVIKTLPGMAQAAASAIDSLNWTEIVGTIAGDDTLMIICRAEKIAEELSDRFSRLAKGSNLGKA